MSRSPRAVKPASDTSAYLPSVIRDIGKPIVDSAEPLHIKLTKQDIAKAVPRDPTCCAFANACKRDSQILSAFIFRSTAYLEYPRRIVRFNVPASMRSELITLDRAGNMEPGDYWLAPIPASSRLGQSRPTGSTKKTGKKRPYHFTTNIRPLADNS